jgi:GMP synthase (glutamine-hydrolysing)
MPETPRFLIIDGYPKKSRDQFDEVGMKLAWVLYEEMLHKYLPEAKCDVALPSDNTTQLPSGGELEKYDGILWTGCNLTVYHDDNPVVTEQLDLAREAYEIGIPSFGSCWAIQVAAVAAGGKVEAHPKGREMGIARKIHLTPEGLNHPMYEGKPPVFDAFVSHDDQVTDLPEGAKLLASNNWTRVQAMEVKHKKGTFWGLQYHPEYNLHELARLILAREEKLIKQGMFKDHDDLLEMVGRLEEIYKNQDRKDYRWQLGIDEDVILDSIRQKEFSNWVKYQAAPYAQGRR